MVRYPRRLHAFHSRHTVPAIGGPSMDKEQTQLVPVATVRTTSLIAPQAESLPYPAADPALLEVLLQPRLALFWGAHTPTRTLLAAATTLASRGQGDRKSTRLNSSHGRS